MRYLRLHAATGGLSCALWATAQDMSHTTSTVTTCFAEDAVMPTPCPGGPVPGRDCLVDGPGCGATLPSASPASPTSSTPSRDSLGHEGGPRVTDRPGVPEGFTTAVETCTACGDEPLTRTRIYLVDGAPYVPVETALAEHLDESAGRDPAQKAKQGGEHGILVGVAPVHIVRDILLAAFGLVFAPQASHRSSGPSS
ncbi:uncharacterized protein J7T54_007648 [Emericellopsis cladophorae]|uniref:Uncharacterized protein n=1 Tax=Emericellopsis cladophorae TaxID=2686198 RepID=A0A9P9XVQ2_9HYPO|nr:uncharacterized protein J7T54_007648 [Emericellopsis cladophorae]KAI6778707.1 hypothetical protein J7T54_007648 [Emericellopsis cladophorae]